MVPEAAEAFWKKVAYQLLYDKSSGWRKGRCDAARYNYVDSRRDVGQGVTLTNRGIKVSDLRSSTGVQVSYSEYNAGGGSLNHCQEAKVPEAWAWFWERHMGSYGSGKWAAGSCPSKYNAFSREMKLDHGITVDDYGIAPVYEPAPVPATATAAAAAPYAKAAEAAANPALETLSLPVEGTVVQHVTFGRGVGDHGCAEAVVPRVKTSLSAWARGKRMWFGGAWEDGRCDAEFAAADRTEHAGEGIAVTVFVHPNLA